MDALWQSDLAPLVFVALFAVCGWLGYPLVQALRRRIEGKPSLDLSRELERLRREVDDLSARLDGMGSVAHRVEDMEERLDFAERLLTRSDPMTGKQDG